MLKKKKELEFMKSDQQKRSRIIKKIKTLPINQLDELEKVLFKNHGISEKSDILSFAGSWADLDEDVFNDLTENLIKNRQKNQRRYD